jgi:hypothetical protein
MRERVWGVLSSAVFWTALFTGFLTVFSFMLVRISNTTSEIERSSQRAFLIFFGPQNGPRLVANASDPSSPWTGQEISIQWFNAGNTPAREAIIKANAMPFFPDIPDPYDFSLGSDKTQVVIGPKQQYGINAAIGKDVIADAFHNKKRLFLWGAVVYKDVFPNSADRLTEFCVELTHLTLGMATPAPSQSTSKTGPSKPTTQTNMDIDAPGAQFLGFQWQQCKRHNCYDDDCSDYRDRIKDMRE